VSVRSLEPPAAAAARAGLPADPRTLPDDAIENPFASPVPESWRRDPSLLNELGRLAHHHDTAWRVLLALGGFAPGPVAARDEPAAMTIGVDDGPEISAEQTVLRDQVLARWQHALLRLWLADPGASVDVRRALAGAARLPDVDAGADATRIVPVWTASDTEAAELLAVLERDGISQASIADFAKGWAARNGGAAAWVIDDAGPTIGIVNLTPDPTIASWFGEAGWNLREDVIRLDPRAGIAFRGASAGTRIVGGVQASRVEVGPWIGSRAVLLGGIEAEPPGPVLGPFQEDLTMSAWVEAAAATRPVTKPAAPRTVARLERREPPGRGSPFSSNALWTLVIECAAAPRAEREGDHVDLWFGPRGSARSVVRVHHDGRLTAERGPALDASWTPIPAEPDRWLAIVPLPEGVIDADGRLMLGMTRTEPEGRRSAWPRPMLPWQREPGRISIDTSGWTRIESDR
jgi:hypothetical protein